MATAVRADVEEHRRQREARGIAARANDLAASDAPPVRSPEVTGFPHPLLAERGYPLVAARPAGGEYADSPVDPGIEFDLHRVLDGIERLVRG
ncbi:hypothetical protein [Actinophytocola sp.]|uniref:hypothetical protein n=1 Tax=Actinophytocola sp. TaxID=1872138 RepID=UPI00389B24D1